MASKRYSMSKYGYVQWQDIDVNDEFLSYFHEHSFKDVMKKYNLSARGLQTLIKYYNISKTSDEIYRIRSKASKGRTPWNKGLTIKDDERLNYCTDEIRLKKSLSMIGKNKGRIHSEQSKKNMSAGYKYHDTSKNRRKLSDEEKRIASEKSFSTKKINGTLNISTPEKDYYKYLIEKYGDENIIKQYKCDRYPWHCDFYIKSLDMFIELNLHWTHGGRPFDPNNIECIKQLNKWNKKAKTSKFYANAIKTWTVRDVEKLKCAKENNLNLEVLYAI